MGKYYIGFDCGTQSVKVAIYNEKFDCMAEAGVPTKITYPQANLAEMDAEDYLEGVREGIRQCVEKSGIQPDEIVSISGSGIIAGLVGVDEDFRPVTPYIPYLDLRAVEEWQYVLQNCEPLWQKESGNIALAPYTPPFILRWMQHNIDGFAQNVAKVVNNGPFVLARLAGLGAKDAFIDHATLSGWCIGYNAATKQWSDRQIEILGWQKDKLPRIVQPWDEIGVLSQEEAQKIGIPAGIKIYAGAGDTLQSNLGCGMTEPGVAADIAGTAAMLTTMVEGVNEKMPPNQIFTFMVGTLENTYYYSTCLRAGGMSLTWFKNNVCLGDETFYDTINKQAEDVPPGANGIVYLPYIVGGDNELKNASGCFLNLTGASTRSEMWRAVLESIAFEYLAAVDILRAGSVEINKMIVTEGGSKSPIWNQIKADVLGVEVITLKQQQGAVMANAALAAYAAGDIPSIESVIDKAIVVKDRYLPNPENVKKYRELYERRNKILFGPMLEVFADLKGES